ncbi:MAG TPA: PDZ domain-containing protein, partial [Blastocatellia bacterium]|nr:PDZ domain-containing protein [Blastocatellia bacterium]
TTGTAIPSGGGIFGPALTPLQPGQIAVTGVAPDSPGAQAGLDIGDILVAMDGDRIDPSSFDRRLSEKKIGSTIEMTVMRRNRLMTISVPAGSRERIAYSIKEKNAPTELQKKIFMSWLGEKQFEP